MTGDKLLAESGDASNRWPRSGFSTKARKRRELEPAKRLKSVEQTQAGPKGKRLHSAT